MTAFPKPVSRITVEDLKGLSRDQLAWFWERTYGCAPPKGVKRGLLEHAAAWHLQAKRQVRDARSVQSRMSALVKQKRHRSNLGSNTDTPDEKEQSLAVAATAARAPRSRKLQQGTRLVREWNGQPYVVDVVENGFILDGSRFTSLTALATHITGTHWSGPRFFGL